MDVVNFYEDISDPENLLSSRHALDSITLFEKTVEIIGIVDSVDSRENLFKFVLRNHEGDRVQVLAWGDEAKRVQGYIKMNFVTHIDAGFAKLKNAIHSKGNIKFDITIMPNTKVNVLKKIVEKENDISLEKIPLTKIEDVLDTIGMIAVEGYLNSKITPLTLNIGQTCLVDGEYKLEIRVQQYESSNFDENQHVKVIGQICDNGIPYLQVSSIKHINIISKNSLSLSDLLRGTKIPKRKISSEYDEAHKKYKLDSNENSVEKKNDEENSTKFKESEEKSLESENES